jgi:hypothetical protein
MSADVTHKQKLSMERAKEGEKALQDIILNIDALLSMLPATIAELAKYDGPPPREVGRIEVRELIKAAQARYDARAPIKAKFAEAVTRCANSLAQQEHAIFNLSSWHGASEQKETLRRAADHIKRCANAISYDNGKTVIEDALAEAKDLMGQSIRFLETEGGRFVESKPEPPALETPNREKPDNISTKATKFSEVIELKISTPFGTIYLGKLFQFIKERFR